MGSMPTKIIDEAMRLSPAQRAALASSLIESLEGKRVDAGAEAAWAREIARRIAEIEAGKVKLVPWSQVRRRVLARIHASAQV